MEKPDPFQKKSIISRRELWRCVGAEFLGMFLLMFICCGAELYTKEEHKLPLVGVALCWGVTVATLAEMLGHVSGCHMNPAVTLAMLVAGKIEPIKSLLYILTQCVSSIIAILALRVFTSEKAQGTYGVISVADDLSKIQGVGIEFLMTFALILTIFSVSDENRKDMKGSAPLAVGLCVTMLIFLGAHMTGTCLNPARALGPAVVMGIFQDQWVYWVAPIGGSLVAAIAYEQFFRCMVPGDELSTEAEAESTEDVKSVGFSKARSYFFSCC